MGSLIINHSRIWDNRRILVIIPPNMVNRKKPFSFFQTSVKPSFFIFFRVFQENELILSRSYLYIPVIRAMVPPEIPGTISAAPISIPFRKRNK